MGPLQHKYEGRLEETWRRYLNPRLQESKGANHKRGGDFWTLDDKRAMGRHKEARRRSVRILQYDSEGRLEEAWMR